MPATWMTRRTCLQSNCSPSCRVRDLEDERRISYVGMARAPTSRHFARVGARATEIRDGWAKLAMVGQRAGSWHGERWVAERRCSFRSLGAMAVFAAVPSAGILRANTFHPSGPVPHDKAL